MKHWGTGVPPNGAAIPKLDARKTGPVDMGGLLAERPSAIDDDISRHFAPRGAKFTPPDRVVANDLSRARYSTPAAWSARSTAKAAARPRRARLRFRRRQREELLARQRLERTVRHAKISARNGEHGDRRAGRDIDRSAGALRRREQASLGWQSRPGAPAWRFDQPTRPAYIRAAFCQ